MNSASIIGNLGEVPVINKTADGTSVTTFSVATTEKWKKNGVKQEKTTWHKVQAWGTLADVCAAHLTKGSKLYVAGHMDNQQWTDQHGVQHKHWMILVMEKMEMLGDPGHRNNGDPQNTQNNSQPKCSFTYKQMKDADWTDEMLLADPQYAHLVPKPQTPIAPPTPPTPPIANNVPPSPPTGGCAGSPGFVYDGNDVGI